jgi:sugar transferase (PEP-CTERM system associated)
MARLFNRYLPTKDLLFFFMEGLIISACVLLAIFIRFLFNYEGILRHEHLLSKILFFTLLCQATIFYNDLYFSNLKEKNRLTFIKLLQSIGIASVLLAISYFFLPMLMIGRGFFIITIILLVPVLFIWRMYYQKIPFLRKDNENILIIGTGDLSIEIGKKIIDKGSSGYKVVGYIDEDRGRVGQRLFNPSIIGSLDDIIPIVQNKKIDKIIIAMAEMRGKFPVDPLLRLRLDGIEVEEGISFYEKISGKIHVSHLKPGWLIFSEGFQRRRIAIGKRLIDVILSTVGLILAAPIMLIIAILIKLDSPGPVLFRQERVGEGAKVFVLLKFRSMRVDAESKTGPIWASEDDQRATRVGRFIRKVRIDELPQMINVLKGDMSFVGPRPERPQFIDMLEKEIPFYSLRHSVKPGITGWAQVRCEYGASVEDAMEKLQYDIYYIKNMSLLFDLSIVLETTKTVLLGEGSR